MFYEILRFTQKTKAKILKSQLRRLLNVRSNAGDSLLYVDVYIKNDRLLENWIPIMLILPFESCSL